MLGWGATREREEDQMKETAVRCSSWQTVGDLGLILIRGHCTLIF